LRPKRTEAQGDIGAEWGRVEFGDLDVAVVAPGACTKDGAAGQLQHGPCQFPQRAHALVAKNRAAGGTQAGYRHSVAEDVDGCGPELLYSGQLIETVRRRTSKLEDPWAIDAIRPRIAHHIDVLDDQQPVVRDTKG